MENFGPGTQMVSSRNKNLMQMSPCSLLHCFNLCRPPGVKGWGSHGPPRTHSLSMALMVRPTELKQEHIAFGPSHEKVFEGQRSFWKEPPEDIQDS